MERKIIQFRDGNLKRKLGIPVVPVSFRHIDVNDYITTDIPIILKTGFCGLGGVGGFVVDALPVPGVGLEGGFSDMAADTVYISRPTLIRMGFKSPEEAGTR